MTCRYGMCDPTSWCSTTLHTQGLSRTLPSTLQETSCYLLPWTPPSRYTTVCCQLLLCPSPKLCLLHTSDPAGDILNRQGWGGEVEGVLLADSDNATAILDAQWMQCSTRQVPARSAHQDGATYIVKSPWLLLPGFFVLVFVKACWISTTVPGDPQT